MKKTAVVIGAGPAGLSAALGLSRRGYEVQVIEQNPEVKRRVCGSFINPDGVRALAWLGLLNEAQRRGAIDVTATAVSALDSKERFIATQQAGTPALAFPRQELETMLAESARLHGAAIVFGRRASGFERRPDGWRVSGSGVDGPWELRADVLVKAGGRFADLSPGRSGGWYGWNARFEAPARKPGDMSMHFGRAAYAGVLTFSDGTTNVCGLARRAPGSELRWGETCDALMREAPSFARALAGAHRLEEWRGVGPLPFGARVSKDEGAVLVGDAAAVGDPFMGEGIGRALASGPLIANALDADADPASLSLRVAALWRSHYRARLPLGRAARWILNRPRLSTRLVAALARPTLINGVTPIFHRGVAFAQSEADRFARR